MSNQKKEDFATRNNLKYKVGIIREIEEVEDLIAVLLSKLGCLKQHKTALELQFEDEK